VIGVGTHRMIRLPASSRGSFVQAMDGETRVCLSVLPCNTCCSFVGLNQQM